MDNKYITFECPDCKIAFMEKITDKDIELARNNKPFFFSTKCPKCGTVCKEEFGIGVKGMKGEMII